MRRNSREMAFKLIFESLFNENAFSREIFDELKEAEKPFAEQIIVTYKQHRKEIEEKVKKSLKSYNLDRVYKLDLALLYEAVTEIDYLGTPKAVAINEVLEIAKIYSTDDSPKFINGILSSLIQG